MIVRSRSVWLASAAILAVMPGVAFAQAADTAAPSKPAAAAPADQASSPAADSNSSNIVVTGTLLRGIAPTGTNVVSLSAADIAQSGATSTNQLLARIPEVSSAFGTVPGLSGSDPGNSIVRPNIRNLGAAGGTTTLVLVDGHRQVDAGILQTAPDPDVIPPAVLERVDVIPDGGSSTYGSDAVGGVINFITRKRFDGAEVDAHYGFADNYQTFDTNLTVGRDWGSGSAYISYNYADHDAILGRDRAYAARRSPQTGFCNPGTVVIGATSYALPDRTPDTIAQCDLTDYDSIIPAVRRGSEFASFNQELTDGVSLNVTAFHTRRETTTYYDPNGSAQSGVITSSNPFYVPIGASDPGSQTVDFTFAGVETPKIHNTLEEFGITPTVTADLGNHWQLRVLGNFQRSTVFQSSPLIDAVALANGFAGTTSTTALDPYDPAATSTSVLDGILITEHDRARQNLVNGRAIVDGSLATLPGGDVKLAVGTEFMRQSLADSIVTTNSVATTAARTVWSAFGEIAVPLVGHDNAMTGIQALTLSASGRYDHYSDFGGTFNPKFGFNYKPIQAVTIRGNWGKSFNAPSLDDKSGAPDTRAILIPVSPWTDPNDAGQVPSPSSRSTVLLAGGNPALKPQKAKTWSVGADIKPVAGMTLSATYYNIKLRDVIGIIPIFTGNTYVPAYAAYYIKNPTLAQLQAAVGSMPLVGGTSLASLYTGGASPYVLLDARRANFGMLHQDGIDFNGTYRIPTGFGSVDATLGGTYTLHRTIAGGPDQPFTNDLKTPGSSRFGILGSLGVEAGGASGSVTWTHRGGYGLNPALGTQTRVDAFDTVDLFLGYDIKAPGPLHDVMLSVTVTNIFNASPSFYNLDPGYTNGSTVGRLIQLGISKKF